MVAAGVTLVEGNGVPQDEEAGIRWLKKASDLDCAQAHYELGTILYLGEAVEEDEEGAVALFKRAAAKQHAAGMFMLGDCMLEGDGCAREPGRAVPLRSEVNIELNFPPKLRAARSRLYRRRFLQVNTRWKALAEIYTMHSFAPFSNLKFFVKNRQKKLRLN